MRYIERLNKDVKDEIYRKVLNKDVNNEIYRKAKQRCTERDI